MAAVWLASMYVLWWGPSMISVWSWPPVYERGLLAPIASDYLEFPIDRGFGPGLVPTILVSAVLSWLCVRRCSTWNSGRPMFPGILKRRANRRLLGGRCPQCDYDLRDDVEAGCPECGWKRSEAKP
jgi:hypothetical protein